MSLAVGLVLLALTLVLAQNPSKPQWPKAFSASIYARRNVEPHHEYFRWFWDENVQKDRFDGMVKFRGEEWFAEIIADHPSGIRYNVFYQNEEVVCYTNAIKKTMFHPNMTVFNYHGKSMVNFRPAYEWIAEDTDAKMTWHLFDDQGTREILRVDAFNHTSEHSEAWTFWEMDVGPQDPNLFILPSLVEKNCTPAP